MLRFKVAVLTDAEGAVVVGAIIVDAEINLVSEGRGGMVSPVHDLKVEGLRNAVAPLKNNPRRVARRCSAAANIHMASRRTRVEAQTCSGSGDVYIAAPVIPRMAEVAGAAIIVYPVPVKAGVISRLVPSVGTLVGSV